MGPLPNKTVVNPVRSVAPAGCEHSVKVFASDPFAMRGKMFGLRGPPPTQSRAPI